MKDKGGDRTRSHLTSPPHLPLLCPYYGSDTEHEEEEHLQWWHNVRKVFFFRAFEDYTEQQLFLGFFFFSRFEHYASCIYRSLMQQLK